MTTATLLPPPLEYYSFTAEEYHRMGEVGLIGPEERTELVEGKIIRMNPIGHRHAVAVAHLQRLIIQASGVEDYFLWPQNPLRLEGWTEVQPDLMVLAGRADAYAERRPTVADVLLLAEISDTTLRYDREVKVPMYARHGVAEVWIVDLESRAVEVHRDPDGEGAYRSTAVLRGDDELTALHVEGLKLRARDLFLN